MLKGAPLTPEEVEVEKETPQLLAPLWDVQPVVAVSTKKRQQLKQQQQQQQQARSAVYASENKQFEYEYDISSLALSFVPFPFTSGGGCTVAAAYCTMDASEARRFSTSTAERVGLLKSHHHHANGSTKSGQYGAMNPDPAEIESLLGRDGTAEELGTTAGQETRLLLKYSVPLMGTYLLQYSFSLVTIFVVGHSEFICRCVAEILVVLTCGFFSWDG